MGRVVVGCSTPAGRGSRNSVRGTDGCKRKSRRASQSCSAAQQVTVESGDRPRAPQAVPPSGRMRCTRRIGACRCPAAPRLPRPQAGATRIAVGFARRHHLPLPRSTLQWSSVTETAVATCTREGVGNRRRTVVRSLRQPRQTSLPTCGSRGWPASSAQYRGQLGSACLCGEMYGVAK